MAAPNLLAGNRFRLYRSTALGPPEVFSFICLAMTVALTETNDFEDTTVPDCASPTSIPNRQSVLRSRSWGLTFSGSIDANQFAAFRTDASSETPVRYQILVDKTLALGGGAWTGAVFFESLVRSKTNNGIVTFTATCRGDAGLAWTDAAA